jgi:hypothetical protein
VKDLEYTGTDIEEDQHDIDQETLRLEHRIYHHRSSSHFRLLLEQYASEGIEYTSASSAWACGGDRHSKSFGAGKQPVRPSSSTRVGGRD